MPESGSSLVSVVVPAYNAVATIRATLASVVGQDHPFLDIVVVDDGSTDATVEVVEQLALGRPVRVVRKPNGGVASARNRGLAEARGEWVAFVDADDVWHPTKISRQIAAAQAGGPSTGLVYCLSRAIDGEGRIFFSATTPARSGDVHASLILNNFLGNGSAPLVRRDVLLDVGGFDESLNARGAQGCEDIALYLKVARAHDFACVDAYLVGYRAGPDSMSSDPERMLRSWELVMDEEWALFPYLDRRLRHAGRGMILRWLAMNARRKGRQHVMLGLLRRAAIEDPGGMLCYAATRAVFRLGSMLGFRSSLALARAESDQRGVLFADAPAERSVVAEDPCERRLDRLAKTAKRPGAAAEFPLEDRAAAMTLGA